MRRVDAAGRRGWTRSLPRVERRPPAYSRRETGSTARWSRRVGPPRH